MANRKDTDILLDDILAEYDTRKKRDAERQKALELELFGNDEPAAPVTPSVPEPVQEEAPAEIPEDIPDEVSEEISYQAPEEPSDPEETELLISEDPIADIDISLPDMPGEDAPEEVPELGSVYDDMGLFRRDLTDALIEDQDMKPYAPETADEDGYEDDGDDTGEPGDDPDGYDEDGYDDEDYEDTEDGEGYEDEYEDEPRPKKRSGAGKLVFALILVTVVISVAIIGSAAVISASSEILGLNKSGDPKTIEIPENTTTSEIAAILASEGIINDPKLFGLFSRFKETDGTYQSGQHKLIPNMTYGDIIEELQRKIVVEQRETVTVTFEEGIRLDDAAKLLEKSGVCSAEEFIKVFNNTTFGFDFEKKYESNSLKYYKKEGYLFPDTYEFYKDEDPSDVAKKILRNFDNKLTPDYYGRMEDMDMDLDEVITLASIVQREASSVSDMKTVASVFLNRLNDPETFPKLQSDPTSNYSENVVRAGLEVYSQSICDAYDTYKGEGLPPGAICNPGIDAIEAVLYPKDTKYHYFCSNVDTGKFFYAETLEEHEENLEAAGIR